MEAKESGVEGNFWDKYPGYSQSVYNEETTRGKFGAEKYVEDLMLKR